MGAGIGSFKKRYAVVFALMVCCLAVLASDASGQGTRRKRVPPVSSTPVPVPAGDAQIISRAADFPDTEAQDQQLSQDRPEVPVTDPDETTRLIADLRSRIAGLEAAKKPDQDEKQKRLLMNMDILNRAEQRSESLRKQLFELMEKESTIKTKLDLIEVNIRPEAIEREVSLAGTMRPEDLRDLKKRQLEAERTNLQNVLTEIQKTKGTLEQSLARSETVVEKLRVRLEKEIDNALAEDPSNP